MIHRILVNPGTPQAWEIVLQPGVNRIGSSPDNDFAIAHPSVSPAHCELVVGSSAVLLKDLGSQSGTFVGGNAVREIMLQSGQHIQIGAVDTIFEARPAAGTAAPVNQPAPGATIVVASFGSPKATEPVAASRLLTERETDSESTPPGPDDSAHRSGKFPVHRAAEREVIRRKQFILGVAGAITGSLVGLLVWFLLIKSTGSPLLVLAWGVGGVTGLGAVLLAKHGGVPLGLATAICALVGIVAGQTLAAKAIRDLEATNQAIAAYRTQLEFAKEAVRADSPDEFRKLLAQATQTDPQEITDDQINNFQQTDLAVWRDFALGRPSKADFTAEMERKFAGEFDYKLHVFKTDMKSGLFMILFSVLGIVTAYKIASGKGSTSS